MDEKLLLQLLKEKKYLELKKNISKLNPPDIAEFVEELDQQNFLLVFRILPKDIAVEVFAYFNSEQQLSIIQAITDKELYYIIDELFFDDMIDLLEEMPANVVDKILRYAKEDERQLINQFLKYPSESAGSLMTIEYVNLKKGWTVKEALHYIKIIGLDKETVYTCYVTDQNRKLEGIVSLRKLVISEEDDIVEHIMYSDFICLNANDDQEHVAHYFKKYDFMAMPVVDNEQRLIGIITFDDIMDVMEQEVTEDIQKMAAITPSEDGYLETPVLKHAKNRITWLMILMLSATFTGGIIKNYELLIQKMVILTSFIPMLMDTAGNSGSQPTVLIIRGLALGEIEFKDIGKVLKKEFLISLLVGISLAFVNFFRIILFDPNASIAIALTVSFTLIVTVMLAKLVGGSLPLIAKKMKLDPAIMAGPLITTIVDALSLIVYFSFARFLLHL